MFVNLSALEGAIELAIMIVIIITKTLFAPSSVLSKGLVKHRFTEGDRLAIGKPKICNRDRMATGHPKTAFSGGSLARWKRL